MLYVYVVLMNITGSVALRDRNETYCELMLLTQNRPH